MLAIDYHITKVIDLVVGTNTFVPILDHYFIHFLRIIPRTQFCHSVFAQKTAHTSVTKVCITHKKY